MDNNSIILYLIVFLISLCFVYSAELSLKKYDGSKYLKYRIIAICSSIIAVAIPCALAAMRNCSVGTDVSTYVLLNYNVAINARDFIEFYNSQVIPVEPLFSLLIFCGAKLNNIGYVFMAIEILIIVPIYLVLCYRRNNVSMTMGMAIFYFLFYNFSLSGMRQGISMSFLLLSYHYLTKKKYAKALFYSIIASLFHSSVILIVLMFGVSYYIYTRSIQKRRILCSVAIFFLVGLFLFYNKITVFLAKIVGIINLRYSYYILHYGSIYQGHVWSNIPITDLLCKTVLIFIVVFFYIRTNKFKAKEKYMVSMMLIGRYFVIFNANFYESLRLAYYFDYLLILFVPYVKKCVKKNWINQLLINLVIIIPSFLYWYYFIMIIGAYQTNVYMLR